LEAVDMPKYSESEIEKRNAFSQRIFDQFEGNMKDFLDYVPLDEDNLKVFSPKLVTLILDVCPELISAFDIAVNCTNVWESTYPELRDAREMLWRKEKNEREHNRSLTFNDYMDFLEKHYLSNKLSTEIVQLIELEAYFKPFELTNTSWANIEWWHTYNLLKHDKYSNRKKATLVLGLKSLGALFCIVNHNSNFFLRNTLRSSIFLPIETRVIESFKKI
jgi:hypothetical protein